jgi:predicted small secreted protein
MDSCFRRACPVLDTGNDKSFTFLTFYEFIKFTKTKEITMKRTFVILTLLLLAMPLFAGCGNTWSGIKNDFEQGYESIKKETQKVIVIKKVSPSEDDKGKASKE